MHQARWREISRYDGGSATVSLPWASDVRPTQFYPERSATPELCLAVAVLEDAVHVLRKYPEGTREWIRAAEWVLSAEAVWPFSFLALCELFGFQAEHVRQALFSAEAAEKATRLRLVRSHRKTHGGKMSETRSHRA